MIDILQDRHEEVGATCQEPTTRPSSSEDESVVDANGRPHFANICRTILAEAKWVLEIHATDRTGQAQSDARMLRQLAGDIEAAAKRLGYGV